MGASCCTDAAASTDAASSSTAAAASTDASASSTDVSASTASQWCEVFINHRGADVKEHAIRSASVYVAIFSPRYAESYWCLNELLLMLESKTLFYRVTPAEIRWMQGKDGPDAQALEILAKKKTYQDKPRYDSNTIENWGNALSQVADNSGFKLEVTCNGDSEKFEMKLLDKIVECMWKMLKKPDLYLAERRTGLDYKMTDFEETVLLQQHQNGKPQILEIWGLGGLRKTTLAMQCFNEKKSDYYTSCFLSDLKDQAKGSFNVLQRRLSKDLTKIDRSIDSVDEGQGMLIKHLESSKISSQASIILGCCEVEALPSMETLTYLEQLWAQGCVKLKSIRGLERCTKLQKLSVEGCSELEVLPSMETLTSLEELSAQGCVKLKSTLEGCVKLKSIWGWS